MELGLARQLLALQAGPDGIHADTRSWPTRSPGNTLMAQVLPSEPAMATTMTVKGQVTIPKNVRDALHLAPGDGVVFAVNPAGEVVVQKAGSRIRGQPARKRDRFEAARGKAQVKWRTDELMALLRGSG